MLLGFNVHKIAGHDGIANIVFKNCAASLFYPLKKLFYRFYSKEICPFHGNSPIVGTPVIL